MKQKIRKYAANFNQDNKINLWFAGNRKEVCKNNTQKVIAFQKASNQREIVYSLNMEISI